MAFVKEELCHRKHGQDASTQINVCIIARICKEGAIAFLTVAWVVVFSTAGVLGRLSVDVVDAVQLQVE